MKDGFLVPRVGGQGKGQIRGQGASGRGCQLPQRVRAALNRLGQLVIPRVIQGKGEDFLHRLLARFALLPEKQRKGRAHFALHGKQARVRVDQHGGIVLLALGNGYGNGRVLDEIPLGHGVHDRPQGNILRGGQRQRVRAAVRGIGRNLSQQRFAGPNLKNAGERLGEPLPVGGGTQSVKGYRKGGLGGQAGRQHGAQQRHDQSP